MIWGVLCGFVLGVSATVAVIIGGVYCASKALD